MTIYFNDDRDYSPIIEKWVNGVLEKIKVEQKVKAKGTIWNDIYSFQYSDVLLAYLYYL